MKAQLIAVVVIALLLIACAPKTSTAPQTKVLGVQETDVTPVVNPKELSSADAEAFDADLDAIDNAFK